MKVIEASEIVDKFVQASKAQGGEYADSYAIGSMRAVLSEAISVIDDIAKAYDNEDADGIRYAIINCKSFLKFMENV